VKLGLRLLLSCLLLAGCGWHLRGTDSYRAPAELHLIPEERYSPLALAMREAMRLANVSDRAEAPLQLHLGPEELEKRVVAVTSIGSPAQYEMSMSTRFRYHMAGNPVTLPQTLSVERVFDFDPSSTVAKREEENTLLSEMRRDLARRVLQQARYHQLPPVSHGQTQP
jgi:outer membrane lipopolysaccharide assembly protein LptE/RlpB